MEELLSLKWNNHKSSFLDILSKLRSTDQFTDVTLACDGRLYSAHKIVLSTCSDYFSTIFEKMTDKNLVIVLQDIKYEDIEALLDYMYLGEVNVRQSELSSLIKVAESLKLRGLAVPDGSETDTMETSTTRKRQVETSVRPKKRKKTRPNFDSNQLESGSKSPIDIIDESSNNNLTDVKKEFEDIVIEDFNCQQSLTEQNDLFTYEEDLTETPKLEPNTEDSQPGTSFQSEPHLWKDDESAGSGKESYSTFSYPEEEFESSQVQDGQQLEVQSSSLIQSPSNACISTNDENIGCAFSINTDQINSRLCPVCEKNFYSVTACRRHVLVHTKEKPFGCPFCKHRCNQKASMKGHLYKIHTDILERNPSFFNDLCKSYIERKTRSHSLPFTTHTTW